MSRADPIFPLINRRAPLLERIRSGENSEKLSDVLASAVGELVKSDDEEAIEDTREKLADNFTSSLADELGVSADDIDQGFVEELTDLITNTDEETVLTEDALESLGISAVEDTDKDEEESEEDNSLFD